jgi:hypothetical protein
MVEELPATRFSYLLPTISCCVSVLPQFSISNRLVFRFRRAFDATRATDEVILSHAFSAWPNNSFQGRATRICGSLRSALLRGAPVSSKSVRPRSDLLKLPMLSWFGEPNHLSPGGAAFLLFLS